VIKSALFVSLQSFKKHCKPNPGAIVISIGLSTDRAPYMLGYAGSLRLGFEDEYEEKLGVRVGEIPDLHPAHQNGARIFYQGNELPDFNDALRVVKFLDRYAAKTECFDLIVHCQAGISRSAAIAQFAADKYGALLVGANPDTSGSNRRLLRLLTKVSDGVPPSIFMPPSKHAERPPQECGGPCGGWC